MQRKLYFPIKGTFYYSAALAMDLNLLHTHANLTIVAEPDNIYDPYALQIWLNHTQQGVMHDKSYLIGYVPKVMTKPLSKVLQNYVVSQLQVTHLAKHGQFIEADCELLIEQPLLKHLYLLGLAKFSHHSQFIKRLKRRWLG